MANAAVLFSGGVDSACALVDACLANPDEEILAIFYDYGQYAMASELAAAHIFIDKLYEHEKITNGIPLVTINIPTLYNFLMDFKGLKHAPPGILTGNFNHEGNNGLPYRNFIFILHALGICESIDARELYIGSGYTSEGPITMWDSTLFAIHSMNRLLSGKKKMLDMYEDVYTDCSLSGETPKLISPMIAQDRHEYVKKKFDEGYPLDLTWSCFTSVNGKPCGQCSSCNSRRSLSFLK